MTTHTALYQDGNKLEADQRISISGGTTDVGIHGMQLAKAFGCKVYASAPSKSVGFLTSLGVDEVRIYQPTQTLDHTDWSSVLRFYETTDTKCWPRTLHRNSTSPPKRLDTRTFRY